MSTNLSAEGDALLQMAGAAFGYGRTTVLRDLDLSVVRGDFIGLVGPNGVGKTTLAHGILGTLRPLAGTVRYFPRRPRFGYVPQRRLLDPLFPITTLDIVMMARLSRGILHRFGAEDRARAREAIESVGLADREGTMYRDLSGGLQQRALIARALAAEPEALVLDEPTAGMDLLSASSVLELIRDLHDRRGLTVILISHALDEVAATVKSLILIEGPGRIMVGPKETVLTEENLTRLYGAPIRVARALGGVVVRPEGGKGAGA